MKALFISWLEIYPQALPRQPETTVPGAPGLKRYNPVVFAH